jgi:uncharacterized protein
MKKVILKMIVFYKKNLSKPGLCRFTPTCSVYAYEVIEKEGVFVGGWKSLKRIIRCNSFLTPVVGTYDPVN